MPTCFRRDKAKGRFAVGPKAETMHDSTDSPTPYPLLFSSYAGVPEKAGCATEGRSSLDGGSSTSSAATTGDLVAGCDAAATEVADLCLRNAKVRSNGRDEGTTVRTLGLGVIHYRPACRKLKLWPTLLFLCEAEDYHRLFYSF